MKLFARPLTLKEQAVNAIAEELRQPSDDTDYARAYAVMQQSEMRRALWSSLSLAARQALVRRARFVANQEGTQG